MSTQMIDIANLNIRVLVPDNILDLTGILELLDKKPSDRHDWENKLIETLEDSLSTITQLKKLCNDETYLEKEYNFIVDVMEGDCCLHNYLTKEESGVYTVGIILVEVVGITKLSHGMGYVENANHINNVVNEFVKLYDNVKEYPFSSDELLEAMSYEKALKTKIFN